MRLERLTLAGFRNLADVRLDLPSEGLALVGRNAQGKSNFLEAIHYLDTFRSFRRARDEQLVRSGEAVFRVHGSFLSAGGDRTTVSAAYDRTSGKKRAKVDDVEVGRLSDAIGTAGTVLFTPDDVALVSGGPDERRRFLDVLLSLNVPGYLDSLQRYRSALSQRNAALREHAPVASVRAWDGLLVEAGATVVAVRSEWIGSNAAGLMDRYRRIAGGGTLAMRYRPGLAGGRDATTVGEAAAAFGEALAGSRSAEARRRTTVVGPHRDEIEMLLTEGENERDLRQFGSGGERRTAALALRLVEADTRRSTLGEEPVLLLDDVFAELDEDRSARIAQLIDEALPGQVFVAVPKETDIRVRAEWLPRWSVAGGRISQ